MKILIVEDEHKTADYLRKGLSEAGFLVDVARDGIDGRHKALTEPYDLIVLDVMLPGIDGWQVLRAIREAGLDTSVIFLTARGDVQDRVRSLDAGADDHLPKPFAFSELLARVRALLRRGTAVEAERLSVADLEVDVRRRRVTRGGERINLSPKEFALIELLMRHKGEVLSRALIASEVWDINFDGDANVIDVAMRRLRLKVDSGTGPRLLQTVRGVGYVLEDPAET